MNPLPCPEQCVISLNDLKAAVAPTHLTTALLA